MIGLLVFPLHVHLLLLPWSTFIVPPIGVNRTLFPIINLLTLIALPVLRVRVDVKSNYLRLLVCFVRLVLFLVRRLPAS
jgi:hypothetical protein